MLGRLQQRWDGALALVRERLDDMVEFRTWFEPMELVGSDGEGVEIRVPDQLFVDWLEGNGYRDMLEECVASTFDRATPVHFVFATRGSGSNGDGPSRQETRRARPVDGPEGGPPRLAAAGGERLPVGDLLPDYVFETFVKGASNELACAASRAVAENPGSTYNPLFIYGGVGLGKTHLLHAIGHEILRRWPRTRVRYVSSEVYMNDFVEAIRREEMQEFRDRYRNQVDVLLIDDIQFFANKDGTQQEFFHTFNALYGANKQIVFSSDRFPEEIPKLEERLRSRFQWGLIADIKAPQIETRVAILEKKAEFQGLSLPQDVALYIAGRIRSNVRQLEGALIRLAAFARLNSVPVTLPMAKEVLKDFLPDAERAISAEDIIKLVSAHYNVKVTDIKGERRHKAVSQPRQVAMYLTRRYTNLSFPEIGKHFGGRDHSTVMSAVRKVEALRDANDAVVKKAVEILERQLEG
jgi:chromosomal replication initiator protein